MDPKLSIVTQLPLRKLWSDSGPINAVPGRALCSSSLREMLRAEPVQFVVADLGRKPRWIELKDCYRFWTEEVNPHLAEPDAKIILNQMPDGYCYKAFEWQSEEIVAPIVVLEWWH